MLFNLWICFPVNRNLDEPSKNKWWRWSVVLWEIRECGSGSGYKWMAFACQNHLSIILDRFQPEMSRHILAFNLFCHLVRMAHSAYDNSYRCDSANGVCSRIDSQRAFWQHEITPYSPIFLQSIFLSVHAHRNQNFKYCMSAKRQE